MAAEGGIETSKVAGAITGMRIDELVSSLAIGIARGQMELDRACMDIAQFMSKAQVAFGKRADSDEPDKMSLIELGFTPNFYQFVDTILEVRVAVSTKYEEKQETAISEAALHSDAVDDQTQYEEQRSSSSSGGGSSGYSNWWWGGSNWGSSGYGYSDASSSRAAGSSSYQAKNLSCTTVDAKYAATYNYSVEASSVFKTKIVPVPPPTVFEEIVRTKVKQRRDEEDRMRLRGKVQSLLPQLANSANNLVSGKDTDKKDYFPAGAGNYKRTTAAQLEQAIRQLQSDYAGLTTQHWAIVNNVPDREAADGAMSSVASKLAMVIAGFDGDNPADVDAMSKLLVGDETQNGIKDDLTDFAKKLHEIHTRLFPPAPAS